jgi:2'-hydroxyisoflavone reductase
MTLDRRSFLGASLALGGLSALNGAGVLAESPPARRLRILMLGGTGFLGPHTVRYALDRGHEVTLFNRGRTNADMFPDLEKLVGNRDPDIDEGLSALEGRSWDAVIDTSGFVPRITGASSRMLADSADQYLFVSTICQYDDWLEGPAFGTEDRPRGRLDDPTTEDVGTHYCALKAYCEEVVEAAMPGRVTQVRPGLIVGPRDGTDRFTYWPVRIARGGDVLAPGKPSDLTQYIDVRDLAAFMVHCLEQGLTRAYNVVRPPMPFGELLDACMQASDSDARLTWVPPGFLAANGLRAWQELQAWVDADGPMAGSLTWSSHRALADGLRIRPVAETVRDTLAWFRTLPDERQATLRSGIPAEKERAVLAAWRAA